MEIKLHLFLPGPEELKNNGRAAANGARLYNFREM
jgi:hypothetical protein